MLLHAHAALSGECSYGRTVLSMVFDTSPQMAHLWLSVKVVQAALLFGSRIINCSQEEAFGNLLSRLADQGDQ